MSRSPDINAEDSTKEHPVRKPQSEVNGSSNYADQYNDPRWRDRSREFIKANPTCQCGSTANLRVHHITYQNGRALWDYADGQLITLCVDCHDKVHAAITYFRYLMVRHDVDYMHSILLHVSNMIDTHGARITLNKISGLELMFRPTGSLYES